MQLRGQPRPRLAPSQICLEEHVSMSLHGRPRRPLPPIARAECQSKIGDFRLFHGTQDKISEN